MARKFDEVVKKVTERISAGRVILSERIRAGKRRQISVGPYRTAVGPKQYALCTLPALPGQDDCAMTKGASRTARNFVRLVGVDEAQNALTRVSQAQRMTRGPLYHAVMERRARLAKAAQRVLDDWQQDEEGYDEVFGTGGACDAIAEAFRDVLDITYVNDDGHKVAPQVMDGGHPGDDHAWLIVYDDDEAVAVDLPPHVYESGSGYTWRKRADVQVTSSDIVVDPLRRRDITPGDY